jgi:23S rRNA pseudouridine955/2504/2580 synthase
MTFSRQNKDLEARFIEVDEHSEHQRLDNFLLRELKKVPKSYIYRIVRSGEVRVNKGRKRADYRLQRGDSVRIPPVRNVAVPRPVKSGNLDWLLGCILYEDDHILAINKPAGMAVHGGSGLEFGIIEAMRKLRPELRFLELVHRLDRDTSGVLLLAKKRSALRAMHESMRGSGFNKHYTALLFGKLEHKIEDLTAPLKKITRGGERMVIVDEHGKPSRSYVTRKQVFPATPRLNDGATLVDIRLFTGRTHQARAHTASIGHAIAGDTRYGDKVFNDQMKSLGLNRLFLHASWLQFSHPGSGSQVKLESPLPEELENVLQQLNNEQAI